MDVQFDSFHDDGLGERAYSNLAHRVVEWFRAGAWTTSVHVHRVPQQLSILKWTIRRI